MKRRSFLGAIAAGIAALIARPLAAEPRIVDVWLRNNGMATDLYARKGEVLECADGHPFARLTRDVFRGEMQQPSDFEALSDAKIGDVHCRCGAPLCAAGGRYYIGGQIRVTGHEA